RDDLDAIHIISHGEDGSVQLGNSSLNSQTLEDNNLKIALWANSFAETGDILIYGCNLVESELGKSLIEDLSALTLTDVAASDDATGHESLGGDWELEQNVGSIETTVAVSAEAQQQWSAVLAATADDDFSYPVGALAGNGGGTGWTGAWGNPPPFVGSIQTNATGLAHPTGGLDTAGGSVQVDANLAGVPVYQERDLASPLGTVDETIWASFLLQPDEITDPNNSYMGLTFGIGGASTNQLFVGYSGTDFKMNSWGGGGVNIDVPGVVSGETVFLVVKIDILASGNETATLYVNPTAGLTNPDVAGSATKTDLDLGTFSTISIAGGRDGATNDSLLDQIRIGSSFADVAPSLTTNEAPILNNLDGNPTFVENDVPVVLDSDVTVFDSELSAADNFDGATLTLVRNGGANAEDVFSATGTLSGLTESGSLVVGGTTIGTVTTNSAGTLVLTFNSNATNALVNSAMQQIAYSNSSSTPPASVQIDWTFDDGNSGAQGSGGALQATGSTTVNITNVAPVISASGAAAIHVGQVYTLTLSTSDPIDSWTINWGDGTIDTIAGGLTSATHTYTVGGLTNNITISATDATGTYYDSSLIIGNAASGTDGFLYMVGFDPNTGLGDLAGAQTLNTPTPSDLDWAADVIIGPNGDIYATGYESDNVVRFDGTTGAFVEEFVTTTQPVSIAFGPDGNLYVASDLGHVKRFDGTTGAYIDDFLTLGFTPEEMTFGDDGNLYVGQYNPGRIYRFDGITGAPIDGGAAFIDPELTGPTTDDINYSEQFAFGPDGNIYVASMTDGKIQRYDGTTGAFIDTFATPGAEPSG
ncbi:MAG: DUF4347 domain-containing protein, partial [Alphaproteobacteria bacterium]|nr:DUF4347 domain-containing protein [Alphaproteobacteria bacterium]